MKMKILLLAFSFCFASLSAQSPEGIITYNRQTDWISIMSKLSYLSTEEIDRMKLTWGKNKNKGTNYALYLKNNKSLYTYSEEQESSRNYSWKRSQILLTRDYSKGTYKDIKEEIGTGFLVEGEIPKRKWKILNEIKEIAGYLCMKAETTDSIKSQTIHAWFADAIPSPGGPEGYGGLPGLILELDINDGDAVITATDVDLETPLEKLPYPRKMKGKKTTQPELNKILEKFIAESIEGNKNPFWRIRY